MTDRNAYITFLEEQVERTNGVAEQIGVVNAGLHQMRNRVNDLDERLAEVSRAATHARDLAADAASCESVDRSVAQCRLELERQVRIAIDRLDMVDDTLVEARISAEAEMARLRNELSLAVQDAGQSFDDRVQVLHDLAGEGLHNVLRDAQSTCVRLADDALAAAETSQRKLEEFARRTDASLEMLRIDLTSVRAEVAGFESANRRGVGNSGNCASHSACGGSRQTPSRAHGPEELLSAGSKSNGADVASMSHFADEIERRLAARFGQQVLQLAAIVRKLVSAQAQQQQHSIASSNSSVQPAGAPDAAAGCGTTVSLPAGSQTIPVGSLNSRRNTVAIDELYRELRNLELHENDWCQGSLSGAPCGEARSRA